MVFNILALISTLIIITLLKRLVNIFPSLIACTTRWKESVNLEASVKNSYDRDIIAAGMVIPFILAADKFRLYDPSFMEGAGDNLRIAITFGVFIAYLMIRKLIYLMIKTRKVRKKTLDAATKVSYTFFILLVLLILSVGSVMSFIGIETEIIKSAMLWISASIYALLLLRKMQIFISGFSIFAGFLYLCALEILPTGLLIASAVIL